MHALDIQHMAHDVGAVAQADFHRHFRAAAGDGLGAHAAEMRAAAQLGLVGDVIVDEGR
jgi:hypothetical protein